MGIDWWEGDPFLSRNGSDGKSIDSRLRALEQKAGLPTSGDEDEGS
jgi:hypothetical protein